MARAVHSQEHADRNRDVAPRGLENRRTAHLDDHSDPRLYRTGRSARRPPEVAPVPLPGVSEYHLQLFPDALADVVGVADLPRRDAIVRVRGRRAATSGPERGKMGGAQRARLAAFSR